MEEKKLKPVTFVSGRYPQNSQNTTQQIMLLNALKITQDPKKLREMIGVRTVADVFRTLDKIAMRKEYHKALDKYGISFDYVVEKLKDGIEQSEKSGDRLKALAMLMKSIGIEKYEETSVGGGSWEDALIKASEQVNIPKQIEEGKEYEVKVPSEPESVRAKREKERTSGKSLYE